MPHPAQVDASHDVVCDDLRLENEYNYLIEKDWILVKLDPPEELRTQRLHGTYGEKTSSHTHYSNAITENDVVNFDDSRFDFVLRNERDYDEFFKFVAFH